MIVFTNYRYLENCFNLWKFDNKKPRFREFKDKRLSELSLFSSLYSKRRSYIVCCK